MEHKAAAVAYGCEVRRRCLCPVRSVTRALLACRRHIIRRRDSRRHDVNYREQVQHIACDDDGLGGALYTWKRRRVCFFFFLVSPGLRGRSERQRGPQRRGGGGASDTAGRVVHRCVPSTII